jgi:hypothetical protein
MSWPEISHRATPCPNCGYVLSASTSLKPDTRPAPGDVAICIECGHIGIFNRDLSIRSADPIERSEILGGPDSLVRKIIAAIEARKES